MGFYYFDYTGDYGNFCMYFFTSLSSFYEGFHDGRSDSESIIIAIVVSSLSMIQGLIVS